MKICKFNYPYVYFRKGKCSVCGHAKSSHFFAYGRTKCITCKSKKKKSKKPKSYWNDWKSEYPVRWRSKDQDHYQRYKKKRNR